MRLKAFMRAALAALALVCAAPQMAAAQGPLRIEITEGVIEPLPVAIPEFLAADRGARDLAGQISRVVAADLTGSGLFREIPSNAFIGRVTSFDSPVQYADWKAINAQALIVGEVETQGDRLTVKFRLFDVFSDRPLGEGLQFAGRQGDWRRMAHKVSDAVYARITGESGYFDSRVVFVSETGPKNARLKRLAVMDYDGANLRYITDGRALVLAPRFSPTGDQIVYTSYASGLPRMTVLNTSTGAQRVLDDQEATMTFAPRYANDGRTIVYSASVRGNTDIYALDPATGSKRRLTSNPSIETSPSFSPDGRQIVFESDRSGTQQLYVMPAGGGEAARISFGDGRYSTPVWSPRGDLIAFTKQSSGRFHIGVMRTDGSGERLLTSSFLDEGPTWAPNGRVLMFSRQARGATGESQLYSVDISGRNLARVPTPTAASDPAWSRLLP